MRPALLLSLLVFAACERPFVEVARPAVHVVAPEDLTEVQTRDSLFLQVEATSFRSIAEVRVNGVSMTQSAPGRWEAILRLRPGLNPITLSATDASGVTGDTTVHALRLDLRATQPGPPLPEPRGGHATTRLPDGTLLVTGGAPGLGQSASDAAFLWTPGTPSFERLDARLAAARTGHAATLLPDGRVLLTGGTVEEGAQGIAALVERAEVFDPVTRTFSEVPVRGAPIRHTLHAALLRRDGGGGMLLELLGGEGDIRYGSNPRYGVREDLRAFRFVRDSLISLTPGATGGIGRFVEALAGHTALSTESMPPGADGRYVVAGARFGEQSSVSTGFSILFEGGQIQLSDAARPRVPRARHAGDRLSAGFFALFGGWQGSPGRLAGGAEIYAGAVDRYYYLGGEVAGSARFGHTATNLGDARILLVGGFTPGGSATATTSFFSFVPFE